MYLSDVLSKEHLNKTRLPGYTAVSSLYKGEEMYRIITPHNSKNVVIVPQQRRPCSECESPCDSCHQCYVDYVYTGLEQPSYCYKSNECNYCWDCKRNSIP